MSSSATHRRCRSPASLDGIIAAHMLYHVPEIDTAVASSHVSYIPRCALIVLNGADTDHLREMRQLMRRTVRDVVGTDYVLPARSAERFTVEAARPVLAGHFEDPRSL